MSAGLGERLDALEQATALAEHRLRGTRAAAAIDHARAVVDKARARLRQGTEHTVVALAGPTGAGKSTLFNALVGDEVSGTGVRRPTTSAPHAAIFGGPADAGLAGLLDWLGIAHRHRIASPPPELDGLVLIDLPDFDSTESGHRVEVDRLVELVDMIVWVFDPQKYADQSLHAGYLRPLAAHAPVMRFVLNKIDTIAGRGADAVADLLVDARRLLAEDGIVDARLVPSSMTTSIGSADAEAMFREVVAQRRAVNDRLATDVDGAVAGLREAVGHIGELGRGTRRRLVDRLCRAAGVDQAAAIVAEQYRRQARREMGWPPIRWLSRWRQPVADLPRVTSSPAGAAEVASAVRDAAVSIEGTPPWPGVLRQVAESSAPEVAESLRGIAVRTSRDAAAPSRWWRPFASTQSALLGIALVGAVWLLAVAVAGGILHLDTDPLLIDTPRFSSVPLPSAMVLIGLGGSLLVALAVRIPVAIVAARRARRFRSSFRPEVEAVADRTVLGELEAVRADQRAIADVLATV